ARQHGVGYYAFSTDREERNRQQQELDSIRDATLEAQKEREDLRKARDKIIADRMKAAKARQRARQGLPPEEEKEEPSTEPEKEPQQSEATEDALYDTSEEKKRLKAEAKAQRKKEKEERKRNRERQKHVRPWDEGKQKDDEMDWKPAREWHVMSQEEWNEMKRKERIDEFAPPIGPLPTDRYEDVVSMPTIPGTEDDIILPEETNRTLFFTTKKTKKEFKRRNYDASEGESGDERESCRRGQGEGAEIAPPATQNQRKAPPVSKNALEASIEAGLRFLREQSDKGGPSTGTKNKWTSNADY
ncbi:AAEL014061-PA, partial [Aedes aegypti]